MARPIFVFSTSNTNPPIDSAARASNSTCVCEITAPPMLMGSVDSNCGKGKGLRVQIIMAKVCSRMETPMAVIRGRGGGVAQAAVGDPLDDDIDQNTDGNGAKDGGGQFQVTGPVRHIDAQQFEDGQAHHGADHEHVAVGEVDQVQNAVHHCVTEGD